MRITIYMCCLLGLTFSHSAQASFNPHKAPRLLIDYTKTKSSPVRSKSPYKKYAKVSFILDPHDDLNRRLGSSSKGTIPTPNFECDRSRYPFTTKPDETKCEYIYRKCQEKEYYGCGRCFEGWVLSNGDCILPPDADEYPYPENEIDPNSGTTECKKIGAIRKCRFKSCELGWTLVNRNCVPSTCSNSDYPYTTDPGTKAGKQKVPCKTGKNYQYGYEECNQGWNKNGAYCNIHPCSITEYPYTNLPDNSLGTIVSCKSGENWHYGYTSCSLGYILKNGHCNQNKKNPGDIYYYGEDPIGMVYYDDDKTTKILGLDFIQYCYKDTNSLNGGLEEKDEISTIPQPSKTVMYYRDPETQYEAYPNNNSIFKADMDGKAHTNRLLEINKHILGYSLPSKGGLSYVKNYAPETCSNGSFCGKGQWYIPASGEVTLIHELKNTLYKILKETNKGLSSFRWNNANIDLMFMTDLSSTSAGNRLIGRDMYAYGWKMPFGCFMPVLEIYKSCSKMGSISTKKPENCARTSICEENGKTYYSTECEECPDGSVLRNGECVKNDKSGTIYYHNGKPIGVVYFDDGKTTKIVALTDIGYGGKSIKDLTDNDKKTLAWLDFTAGSLDSEAFTGSTDLDNNGKKNTETVRKYIQEFNGDNYAAFAVKKYAPEGCEKGSFCGMGEWYIPAGGDWSLINANMHNISAACKNAGGQAFSSENYYWISTIFGGYDSQYLFRPLFDYPDENPNYNHYNWNGNNMVFEPISDSERSNDNGKWVDRCKGQLGGFRHYKYHTRPVLEIHN